MTTHIDVYEILGELGRGGAGCVYRTKAPSGEDVALKLLLDSAQAHPNQRKRFLREAESLARLDHPHVVKVRAVGEHQACPYLVMDLIEGSSLQARLDRDGPLDPRAAAKLAHGLALGLDYCHGCGVIHRDLKPDNVLLTRDGSPLLTDFGLSKDLSTSHTRLSSTGSFMGTPGFWAPELARGDLDQVDARTDVYGLGATLYAMLTGRPPIEGESLVEILVATESQTPTPPRESNPAIDPGLEAICLRCLAKAPSERYASAGAVARDLSRFLRGDQLSARVQPPRSRAAPLAAVLIAGGGLVAMGIVVSSGTRPPEATPPSALPPTPASAQTPAPPLSSPQALLAEAQLLFELDSLPEALALCDRALSEEPELAGAWGLRGKVYAMLQRWEESERDLSRALELDAEDFDRWADRGRVRSERGDLRGSIEDYTRCLELNGEYAVGFHDRGIARDALGDLRGAIGDYTRAIELDPDMARAYSSRAGALLNAGDPTRALSDAERSLELDPQSATAYLNKGAALGRLDRLEEAVEAFDRALQINPSHSLGWLNRASTRLQMGQVEGALSDLERARELAPNNGLVYLSRGMIKLQDLGDLEGAVEDLARARQLLPARSPYAAQAERLHREAVQRLGQR